MKQIIYSFLIVCMLFFSNCNNNDYHERNLRFIQKYENENFDIFINTGFLIRGRDQKGNYQIFVTVDSEKADTVGPYIITFDGQTKSILNSSSELMKESVDFDKDIINSLIPVFFKYNIFSLEVDKEKNVFIRVRSADKPTLIRFSDLKYKTQKYSKFKKLKGNWFEME